MSGRSRVVARLLVLAAGCLVPAAVAAAENQGPPGDTVTPVELSWVRLPEAADCPSAAEVRADVERRLGRPLARLDVEGGAEQGVAIEVLVSRGAEGFRADIEMHDADGEALGSRVVSSDSPACASLAAAAALTVSIMLRPLLAVPEEEARPVAPAPPEQKPAPVVVRAPPPSSPDRASRSRAGFALGAVGALGILPEPALGLESSAELVVGSDWSTRASVTWLPPRRLDRPAGTLSFGATLLGLSVCYAPGLLAWTSLRACAGPFAEVLTAAVERPRPVGRASHWSGGARAGLEVGGPVGPLGVTLGAHALFPLHRRDYLVRHAAPAPPTSLFRQPVVSGLAVLALRMPAAAR